MAVPGYLRTYFKTGCEFDSLFGDGQVRRRQSRPQISIETYKSQEDETTCRGPRGEIPGTLLRDWVFFYRQL